MHVVEGHLSAKGRRFGIVASRTNDLVVGRLVEGALDAFRRLGAEEDALTLVRVPGSWEIPLAVRDLARSGRFDAIVAIGAVIRGGTPHFDYVASEVAKGVFQTSMELDLPVCFGVLTCDSLEQALERSGAKSGNKGFEAATAAVELADLRARLRPEAAAARSPEPTPRAPGGAGGGAPPPNAEVIVRPGGPGEGASGATGRSE